MRVLSVLLKRNVKLFFKDKGMFFTSLITPLILLVLYATFLSNVYESAFIAELGQGVIISEKAMAGLVGGQLVSSLLAVSAVTVAFCSNFLSVQDKANKTSMDLRISPVKGHVLSLAYYISALISTLIISLSALLIGFIYLAISGWFLTFGDVMLLLLDVCVLVLFGTALSSVINYFLSTQGQISAVGSIVSAGYGFVCGAYMPISSFSTGLQRVVSFLPGTYGTALLRTHATRDAFAQMESQGVNKEVIEGLKGSIDCTVYFFDRGVGEGAMYLILSLSTVALISVYILLHIFGKRCKK